MPRVIVRDDESIHAAVRRFQFACRQAGVLTGSYVRMIDRNRQRRYFESRGVKDRRRRHIAQARQLHRTMG
ncbi:MAG: 30S ribosomal protein S21 [Planctomycetaceae bacterium]|nr:30S ribosomal protein S21 [Planctomycetaceae bacterium]